MQNNKIKSWGWIIFWCIIFWPVGLFFLYKKLSGDKSATLKNSKTVSIISYVLIGMGIILFLMAFTEGSSMFAAGVLFGGGGIWVNRVAKKMKVNGEKYKKYINLVVNQQVAQIDNIASATGVKYDVVKADLQKMIDSGYFIGAYINEGTRDIVLSEPTINSSNQSTVTQLQTRVIACKSCGAKNSILIEKVNVCEYCDSPIEIF